MEKVMSIEEKADPGLSASRETKAAYDGLASDFAQLREDLKSLKADIASLGAAGAHDAKESLKEGVSSVEEHTREAVDTMTTEFQEIQRQAEKAVRKKPLTAVAAALAIGYFLSGLARK